MKRWLVLGIALFSALMLMFTSVTAVRAAAPFPDTDEDGLADDLETQGWYNLAGGPFVTDPLKADTDGDGLTDGEEKLFDTHPVDDTSPGLYVRYEAGFQTRQYFSTSDPAYLQWKRGGDRYLMTEAAVLRRGATFRVGGPANATLTLSGSGLTALTPVADACNGGWTVTLPANGTVGTYNLTVSRSGWSKTIPLYVIFQFPTDLTPAQIAAYIYDDDPANLRDEVSVWWRTPEWSYYFPGYSETTPPDCANYPNSPCSAWMYHQAQGYAQAFWTDQFKKSVFVNHAMPAIQGQTTQGGATNAIASWADKEFRVVYQNSHNSWATAMYTWNDGSGVTMEGGACQDNANVFTTILRSAGLAARTFLKDYNKTGPNGAHGEGGSFGVYEYDHSVLIWLDGHWKAARSYNTEEKNDLYYPWQYGYKAHQELPGFGYVDSNSDLIVTSNEGWDWQNGSNGGGMVNTLWSNGAPPSSEFSYPNNNWDYQWQSLRPLEILRTPYMDILNYETWHGDNWAPSEWRSPPVSNPAGRNARLTYYLPTGIPDAADPLENWPYNPVPTGCSPSTPPDVCAAFLAGQNNLQRVTAEQAAQFRPPAATAEVLPTPTPDVESRRALTPTLRLEAITGERGVDSNGNGRWDALVISVTVAADRSGAYQLGGWLQVGEQAVRARTEPFALKVGRQTVALTFDGQEIGDQGVAGPYQVANLWIAAADQPIPQFMTAEEALAYRDYTYLTAAYKPDQFEVKAALLALRFSHATQDTDKDGYADTLIISVPLSVTLPGRFTVQGALYDGEGTYLGESRWSGPGATATLTFTVARTAAPYTLNQLLLLDATGRPLDSQPRNAYQITRLDNLYPGEAALLARTPGLISTLAVTSTRAFTATAVDTNGNGKYDQLLVTLGVRVTGSGGAYRVEGLLVDPAGTPVAWAVSQPQTLTVGLRELTLPFDGRLIHDHLPFTTTPQALTLIGVKLFRGNLSSATLEDSVPVAFTTPGYTRDQFDALSLSLFGDTMERGATTAAQWTAQAPWTLTTAVWHSPNHAWRAAGGNGLLTTLPITMGNVTAPVLRFDTCHQIPSGRAGYVEVSRDGVTWSRVATYTNATVPWSAQQVDLSAFADAATLRIRFNAQTPTSWAVDDVYLNAWPPETYADLAYQPEPVLIGAPTTFIAAYKFITTTPTITFTWAWGDGSPPLVTHVPTVTHAFPQALDYTVRLTVENGYQAPTATATVPVYAQVTTAAVGSGTVYKTPDQPLYRHGDLLTLAAVPVGGWRFTGWSGALSGNTTPQTLTVTGHHVVTATFSEVPYTLTVNLVGNGTVTRTPDKPTYRYNEVVTLTAVAAPGWTFDRWSGDLSGSQNPAVLVMSTDKTVSAVFVQNEYPIVVTVSGSGNVTRLPNQTTYHYGDVVTLTATPAPGWTFTAWSGSLSGSANPQTLVVDGSESVHATFSQLNYTLLTSVSGSGSVTRQPNQPTYHYGDGVTLTATAATGWHFVGWSGDLSGSTNPATLTITGNRSVVATFAPNEYTLTVNVGSGGSVTRSPDRPSYTHGTVVTLTATPAPGWRFVGWSGDLSGSANPATMTMNGNRTVTATFAQIEYTLNVTTVGGGSVSRNPSQATYHYGDLVNLTAIADEGWQFSAWSGDLTGSTNPTAFTIYGHQAVTATFTRLGYTLETAVNGGGTILRTPNQETYLYGDVVTLTAVPDPDWAFTGWSGDLSGMTNPQILVMNGPKSVIASFAPNGYLLSVTITPVYGGSVARNPAKSVYQSGEVVTVTAVPAPGWTFTGWGGDLSGMNLTKTLVMTDNRSISAAFISDQYTLSIHNTTGGVATKSPAKSYYDYGEPVTLTATPSAGYLFAAWTGDVTGTANPKTITVTGNLHITPTYTFVGYILTTTVVGEGTVARNPDLTLYGKNQVVTLTAVPAPGWAFVQWSGALTGAANPAPLTMSTHRVVTATFSQNTYPLTVTVSGNGSVISQPAQSAYLYGDVVTLTAVPAPGWHLAAWGGALSGNQNPAVLTITGATAVTAAFAPDAYTLTTGVNGQGSVGVQPAQSTYAYGEVVTLTAVPAPGWAFAGWSGNLIGGANPALLTLYRSSVVTATFAPLEYSLLVEATAGGTATKAPDRPTYHYGDVVTLTATPLPGWAFVGWSGVLNSSANPVTLTVTDHAAVLATFVQETYTVTVQVNGNGTVALLPLQDSYHYGDVVTLTATAAPGWAFTGWSGGATGTSNPLTLTLTGDVALTATFTAHEYTLAIDVGGAGTVTRDPDRTTYHYGDVVTLTALPAAGWNFLWWEGDLWSTANPLVLTITGDRSLTAVFRQAAYILQVSLTGSGRVDWSPWQDYFHYGDTVVITATPEVGWHFGGWSGDLSGDANPVTVVMTDSRSVIANFVRTPYTVTVRTVGGGSVIRTPDLAAYYYGDGVTLTAVPAVGWQFVGWENGSLDNPRALIVLGNTVVTATFTAQPPPVYTLTVALSGQGVVTPSVGTHPYVSGTVVPVQASPAAGWRFAGWLGPVADPGAAATTVLMTAHRAITATFELVPVEYGLEARVVGAGHVTLDPDWPGYYYGDVVTLTAVPDPDWQFAGWENGSFVNPRVLTIVGDTTVTATFTARAPTVYTLTVALSGQGGVTPTVGAHPYVSGTVVPVEAAPAAGWRFTGWLGPVANPAAAATTVMMVAPRAITATFAQSTVVTPATGITFTVSPLAPRAGAPVTLTATVTPADATRPITCTWAFGDLTVPIFPAPAVVTHTYALPGTYTVQVTATNGLGAPVTATRAVVILAADHRIYLPLVCRNQ